MPARQDMEEGERCACGQAYLDPTKGEPKLSICDRNLDFVGIRGISRIQLVFVPRRFPNSLRTYTASGVWQREASTSPLWFQVPSVLPSLTNRTFNSF